MPASTVQLTQSFVVPLVVPVASAGGAQTLPAGGIDLTDYEGVASFVQITGAGQTPSATPRLTHADATGGPYTNVDGQTFGLTASGASIVNINVAECKKFVRYEATLSAAPITVFMVAFKKYK